jgi:hypothetical protein
VASLSDGELRRQVRDRLSSGALFPTGGRVSARRGTGKPCIVCAKPISTSEIEHEIAGPATVWAHWDCYSIWRQESDAVAQPAAGPPAARTATVPLHIDRLDHDGADPARAEYVVSMGGTKDAVGTVLLGKPKGLSALAALLRGLEVTGAEVETACRALTEQLHHEISRVSVTPAILRRLRL